MTANSTKRLRRRVAVVMLALTTTVILVVVAIWLLESGSLELLTPPET